MKPLPEPSQMKHLFRLDENTGELRWVFPSKYHPELMGQSAGTPISNHYGKTYFVVMINRRAIRRSWIVFCLSHGRWPVEQVDHINGDSKDDRPSNLREATATENAWNHRTRRKSSSLPMGVKQLSVSRFQARIGYRKLSISLGVFSTAEEASQVYQAKRNELYGQFA